MKVAMLGSWEERCGIADYTHRLVEALRASAEIEAVEVVPASFGPGNRALYRALGTALNGADVAHVQHSYAIFGGMHPLRSGWSAMVSQVRRPLVVTLHELDLRVRGAYRLPPPLELAYKRRFNRSVFLHPAVRRWIVHSRELRDGLVSLGAPADRILYSPMPLEPPPAGAPPVRELRQRLCLEGKLPLVILGFLTRRKGYEVALAALRELPPEYVLVAAGGEHAADRTGTEAWLRSQAEVWEVSDRFRITGFLPAAELEAVTALADLVLAPFQEMSASASISYALARGKAVIASDLEENRLLPCVRCFPRGEAKALSAAIREISGNRALKEELQQAAGNYAKQQSYAALSARICHLYKEITGSEEGSGAR